MLLWVLGCGSLEKMEQDFPFEGAYQTWCDTERSIDVIDVYDGDKLPENKKSIAFRVLLQPQDKTFNDQEIEELSNKIIDEISKSLDASIRN